MTDIKKAVDRFLGWPLPRDFAPDCYISFDRANATNPRVWPVGTNLFTADQAREMFEHCLQDQKLAAIENQPVPVEPVPIAWILPGDDNVNVNGFLDCRINNEGEFTAPVYDKRTIDALLSRLQVAQQELSVNKQLFEEELKDGDTLCSSLCFERTEGGRLPVRKMVSDIGNVAIRLKQAESRNKRLVELLRVEVAERCGKPAFICTDDDCCYFGKPATKSCTCHVNKLNRHHAMSAELLREVDN